MNLNKFKSYLLQIYKKYPEFKENLDKQSNDYIMFLYLHLNKNINIDISTKVKKRKSNLISKKITCEEKYCKMIDIIYGKFLSPDEKNIINNTEFYVTCYEKDYAEKESEKYFLQKNRRDFLIPCFFHNETIRFLNNIYDNNLSEYNSKFKNFHILLGKLRKYVKTKERLGVMIDSSFTLKTHNVRRSKDIDLVILHPYYYNKKIRNNLKYNIAKKLKYIDPYFFGIVEWHGETKETLDEDTQIITNNEITNFHDFVFNPNHHYYFFGIKVIKIEFDLGYRANRRYPKNVADLILAKSKLNINFDKYKIKKLEEKINVDNNVYTKKEFIEVVQRYLKKFGKLMEYDIVKKEIESLYES